MKQLWINVFEHTGFYFLLPFSPAAVTPLIRNLLSYTRVGADERLLSRALCFIFGLDAELLSLTLHAKTAIEI